jgi:predicted acyltransferase
MNASADPRLDGGPLDPTSIPAGKLPGAGRLGSIDAYRGLVMFLMMAEALSFCEVASNLRGKGSGSAIWELLCHHQSHVEWTGCVLHDLIQPSFSFLVGVALPFSLASRTAHGQKLGRMTAHALWRSLVLVLLGVFLRSVGRGHTNWTFEDTLSQIGFGYTFLFLLGLRPAREQWLAFVLILVGYWTMFAAYPGPGPEFSYGSVGVKENWQQLHLMSGFPAHWNKNSNPAWAFDVWFLNLLPRSKPFAYNGGGYATLSFIPTLATMIMGLIAGGVLKRDWWPWRKIAWLSVVGAITLGLGWAAGELGVCPVVKRIWTPSWVLYSGGICLLFLAFFYMVMDVLGWSVWAFPLRVIGANSIAAYCLSHLVDDFIVDNIKTHLGGDIFSVFGTSYEPFVRGVAILLVLWLVLFWMYRRKLYVRI